MITFKNLFRICMQILDMKNYKDAQINNETKET